jgi:hypothetical protein
VGDETALLLVICTRRFAAVPALALIPVLIPALIPAFALTFALLAGCAQHAPGKVDPEQYDAFFLWAGVRPPAALGRARTVYILDGEIRAGDNARIVPLRPAAPRVRHADVWLTVRTERIDWAEPVFAELLAHAARWERSGARLVGVQVDFDARTRGLAGYASFLARLRGRLPGRYRLSVTGLLDWSANGDAAGLARLRGIVDEVVIQTYQGRRTIPGYAGYLASLARLPIPYRIGLVQGGEWRPPPRLNADPRFRGYVVFLLP